MGGLGRQQGVMNGDMYRSFVPRSRRALILVPILIICSYTPSTDVLRPSRRHPIHLLSPHELIQRRFELAGGQARGADCNERDFISIMYTYACERGVG